MNAEPERHRGFAIRDVISFSRKYDPRGKCFGGWPDNILEIYFKFHQQNGSLCLVEEDEVLVGLGVGFQCDEAELDRHWVPNNRRGDSIYLSDVICKDRRALATCLDEVGKRYPDWRSLKIFAHRNRRRKQLKPELLERALCYCLAQ